MDSFVPRTLNDISLALWIVCQFEAVFGIHQNQITFKLSYLSCEFLPLKPL